MSTKKKGLFTVSGEWAKHLRKWGKRKFWKKERTAGKLVNIKSRPSDDKTLEEAYDRFFGL